MIPLPGKGAYTRPCGRGGLDTSDGWFIAPPMSSEETPPTPSPPNGEDCALLRSFLLSPRGRPRGGPGFSSRRKRENGPCTVQKRKRSIAPAGGRGTRDAQEVLPPGTHVSCPRRGASGSFGDGRMDQLLFPLPLTWRLRKAPAGYCARSSAINCAPKRTPS